MREVEDKKKSARPTTSIPAMIGDRFIKKLHIHKIFSY
jgi:hypothetical protein